MDDKQDVNVNVTPTPPAATPSPAPEQPTPESSPAPMKEDGNIPKMPKSKMGKKMWMWLVVAIIVIGGAVAAFMLMNSDDEAANTANNTVYKVGVMVPQSGGASGIGFGILRGIQLGQKQLEATNIELISVDSKCTEEGAIDAINSLVEQEVVAIIGAVCSAESLAALPIANENNIVMISPSSSSPDLTVPDDYFFRVVPSDNFQGVFLANYIYDQGITRVASFNTDESYGNSIMAVFKDSFEELGGTVVAAEKAKGDVLDVSKQSDAIVAAAPEALVMASNSSLSSSAIMKAVRAELPEVKLFGSEAFEDPTIIENAGDAAEGLRFSAFPAGSQAFKQAMLDEYNEAASLGSAQGYDIVRVLQLVFEQGASSGEEIKNALPNITFTGVSGLIKFDANGEISDPDYQYDVQVIQDGEFTSAQ